MLILENKICRHEKDICGILSDLAYFIHPHIVARIQKRNQEEYSYFQDLFDGTVDIENYLFDGSACVFPGVRRFVSNKGKKKTYNESYRAIIDDNTFPRHIWCHLVNGKAYSGPNWKECNLNEFELAHIFSHKESELDSERGFFDHIDPQLLPYSDFTCACNITLLPKGTVRPTDNSNAIKSAFYKRYIDLYGEETLNGRSGFNHDLAPSWYSELNWNTPELPNNWEKNVDLLLSYRTKRITGLIEKAMTAPYI